MSNRSPSVSPLASPLRRMQAAGVTGRINPYCSRRANFRSVKEVKACLAAMSDSPSTKKTKSPLPPSSYMIKTPPSRRSTYNVITPEARTMMKEAVAEFSSPLTDVKKIPMRESPIFPLPASKRRKLFDMKDEILKEVEKNKAELKEKEKIIQRTEIEYAKHVSEASKLIEVGNSTRKTCEQELLEIEEIYSEFKFSNPRSLTTQSSTDTSLQFSDEFRFSNATSAKQKKTSEDTSESAQTTEVPPAKKRQTKPPEDKSLPTRTSAPVIVIDKELAERFKPPEGSWECEVCMINNKSDASVCIACTALRPTSKTSKPPSPKICIQPDKELIARFRMGADKWECDTCMIQNSQSEDRCLACDASKPGIQEKDSSTGTPDSKSKPTTGFQLNIKPNKSTSAAPLSGLSGGLKIPGFSLGPVTKTTQSIPSTNPVSIPLTLSLPALTAPKPSAPSKIDFGLSLLKPSASSSTIPFSSITSSSSIPLFKSLTTTTNTSTSDLTSSTAQSAVSVTASTPASTDANPVLTSQPVSSTLPLSFSLTKPLPTLAPLSASQSKETVTSTTYSLPLSQSTPALQPSAPPAPPLASPPRGSHLSLPPPMTPQKSVDEEAMEVIPFSGTLTTPVKGTNSVPTSSPFNFLNNPSSSSHSETPALRMPPQAEGNMQQLTSSHVPPASESMFKGVNPRFQFSGIPSAFQFGGNAPGAATPQQPVTDNSTGQDLKPFQFRAASQPTPQFAPHANQPQSSSQPDVTPIANFTANQPQSSNLFGSQDKPPNSLFAMQPQSSNFGGVATGNSLFNPESQKMPSNNLFKQVTPTPAAAPFQFAQRSQTPLFSPGNFQFALNPNTTPTTPATTAPFPFSGGQPPQPNTPTTPQAPGYNFNVGSNTSSDLKSRVYKTAKRRLR